VGKVLSYRTSCITKSIGGAVGVLQPGGLGLFKQQTLGRPLRSDQAGFERLYFRWTAECCKWSSPGGHRSHRGAHRRRTSKEPSLPPGLKRRWRIVLLGSKLQVLG
jgi:hypothetical protein